MTRRINLIVVPGTGKSQIEVADGWTWNDLRAARPELSTRDLIANGKGVPASSYTQVIPSDVVDVHATTSVKGNC